MNYSIKKYPFQEALWKGEIEPQIKENKEVEKEIVSPSPSQFENSNIVRNLEKLKPIKNGTVKKRNNISLVF